MKITDFLNNEVVNFASYSTLRALASYIDGLKNSHRKVVCYMLLNNVTKEKKVFNLSGEIMTSMEYLHGDISGSVITLAQNYTGTNNMPLLSREGNFGTRFTNEASATRYIYTAKDKMFDYLFNKSDINVLPEQYFEGTKIEPRFFIPTLPLILINGSEGIATGFAQKILPRNIDNIKTAITNTLQSKKIDSKLLIPNFNGFNGIVEQGDNPNQWLIKGSIKRLVGGKFEITEIPVGIDLQSYIKVLDDLEDDKFIKSYKDSSKDDKFHFEVTMSPSDLSKFTDDELLQKFKLIKKVSENYTCVDENNRVKVFQNTEEILRSYIEIKLEYLQKRKDHQLQKFEDDIKIEFSKYLFIKNIVENTLIINKRKKDDIVKDLEKIDNIIKKDNSYDYLLNMGIMSLTEERMDKLQEDIKSKKAELDKLKNTDIKDIWLDELK